MHNNVDQIIEGIDPTSLVCRDFAHSWTSWYAKRTEDGFERGLRCTNCDTRKVQKLDTLGYIAASRYEYPDGYVLKGVGRVNAEFKACVRLASLYTHGVKDG